MDRYPEQPERSPGEPLLPSVPFFSWRSGSRFAGRLGEIPRAREHPQPVRPEELQVQSSFAADGYRLQAFLPAKCLTGYLPQEFDRIRLFYEVADEELGQQPQSLASGYRYNEDPSLWVETHLDRESS
jgi:hypothetical protein